MANDEHVQFLLGKEEHSREWVAFLTGAPSTIRDQIVWLDERSGKEHVALLRLLVTQMKADPAGAVGLVWRQLGRIASGHETMVQLAQQHPDEYDDCRNE